MHLEQGVPKIKYPLSPTTSGCLFLGTLVPWELMVKGIWKKQLKTCTRKTR